jgi:predicted DCC family thiol-disulfide oxidoreductase YuxK
MAIVTVAYDEDCGACRWFADHVRKLDRSHNLNFVPIQAADRQLLPVPKEERLNAMHAITSDGRVYTGGAAIPVIARELPGGRLVGAAAELSPSLTERIYRAAAARRTTIGRWLGADACAVDPSRAGTHP